jgi:hypothetical protein
MNALLPDDDRELVNQQPVSAIGNPKALTYDDTQTTAPGPLRNGAPAEQVVNKASVTFTGTWTFEANAHALSYRFQSGTIGYSLPEALLTPCLWRIPPLMPRR